MKTHIATKHDRFQWIVLNPARMRAALQQADNDATQFIVASERTYDREALTRDSTVSISRGVRE